MMNLKYLCVNHFLIKLNKSNPRLIPKLPSAPPFGSTYILLEFTFATIWQRSLNKDFLEDVEKYHHLTDQKRNKLIQKHTLN